MSPKYPLDRRLGWPQRHLDAMAKRKKFLHASVGNRNPVVQLLRHNYYERETKDVKNAN
jgi:hypothetical protein